MRSIGALAIAVVVGVACSSAEQSGGPASNRQWACLEDDFGDGCSCFVVEPDTVRFGGLPVPRCEGRSCCILTEPPGDFYGSTCECMSLEGSCTAEAASRRDATALLECPPLAEQPPVRCAAAGENCRESYLASNDLEGCCEGLLCKVADGVPTCAAATPEELEQAAACEAAQRGDYRRIDESLVLETLPETSAGQIPLAVDFDSNVESGQGGCVRAVLLVLSGDDCQLTVAAGPETDENGALVITQGEFVCSSLSGSFPDLYTPLTGTVNFVGATCDAGLIFEAYCHAGTFEIRVSGSSPDITIDDAVLRVTGSVCSVDDPTGPCPG